MSASKYISLAVVDLCDFDPAKKLKQLCEDAEDERVKLKCLEVMLNLIQAAAEQEGDQTSEYERIIDKAALALSKSGYAKRTLNSKA